MKENHEKLKDLMAQLEGKDFINAEQCTLMFNLNNTIFPDLKEFTPSCGACRERVYNRLKAYAKNI